MPKYFIDLKNVGGGGGGEGMPANFYGLAKCLGVCQYILCMNEIDDKTQSQACSLYVVQSALCTDDKLPVQ